MAWTLTLLGIMLLTIKVDATANFRGTALLNNKTELRCKFESPQNNSQNIVNYYWQRVDIVVNYLHPNESGKKSVINDRYWNRSILDNDGILELFNVTLEDRGEYTCYRIVQKGVNRVKDAECKFHLDVLANFSVPEISFGSSFAGAVNGTTVEIENGTTVSFQCTSGQGFPKPQEMIWTLSSREGSDKSSQPYEIKNVNETYYISSNLSLRLDEDVNITCELVAHHKAVSQTLHIVVKGKMETPSLSKWSPIIIIICVVLIVSLSVIFVILMVRKKKQRKRRSNRSSRDQELGTSETQSNIPGQPEALNLMAADEVANGS